MKNKKNEEIKINKVTKQKKIIEELDQKVNKIQKSTTSTWDTLTPLHNYLRVKSKRYYNWHLNYKSKITHLFVLFIYIICTSVSFILIGFSQNSTNYTQAVQTSDKKTSIDVPLFKDIEGVEEPIVQSSSEEPIENFSLEPEEQEFFALINNHRANYGRSPLGISLALTNASEGHSQDMANNNYYSHNSLDGRTPWDRIWNAGYTHNTYKGENIAAGYVSANSVFSAWLNSPGHNENMLSSDFNVIGIGRGYNYNSTYLYYWTTDFGGYNDSIPDLTPPTVSISSPSGGAVVSGNVNIQASASDNVGISKVEFYIDDTLYSTDTSAPYEFLWNSTYFTNDYHAIKVIAYDTSVFSDEESIWVDSQNGVVYIPKITNVKNEQGDHNFYSYVAPTGTMVCNQIDSDLWNIPGGNNVKKVAYLDGDKIGVIKRYSNGDEDFVLYNMPSGQQAASEIGADLWSIPGGNDIVSICGLDSDGDGVDELAVLKNENADYNLYIYEVPSGAEAKLPIASDLWSIPSGSNAVSICGVNLSDSGPDKLAILKNESGDQNLYIYDAPTTDEACSAIASDLWNIPGGSNVISMAGVDYSDTGRKDRIAVLKNANGDYGLYVYNLPSALLTPATLHGQDLWNITHGNNLVDLGG